MSTTKTIKKKSRVDKLYDRLDILERKNVTLQRVIGDMRHILVRLDNYAEAYEKYEADLEEYRKEQLELKDKIKESDEK